MLSRAAENLYWMARYIERAGATARLIEMGQRMAMLPRSYSREEWRSVAMAAGAIDLFEDEPVIDETAIIRLLMLDRDNPSSIRSCLERARACGRAVRTALTRDLWEALNEGWRTLEGTDLVTAQRDLPALLDWVKQRNALFRGAATSSMLRSDRYDFVMVGAHVERADMTLRLLDVKYYVLLPETDVVGGGRDHHQWTSVLHATSAMRAYHHVYMGDYAPWKIADFLILNPAFPRSVAFCYEQLNTHLGRLARAYGKRHECHATTARMIAELDDLEMGDVFQTGLHEFIQELLATTRRLHGEIYSAYHF
jgi:uncharacterized alpha-E superfamily protein